MDECCAEKGHEIEQLARRSEQRRVLRLVVAINTTMFVAEVTAGLIARAGRRGAAIGVLVFRSVWPDIIVGLLIAVVFLRSAGRVIREAWPQCRSGTLVHYPAE